MNASDIFTRKVLFAACEADATAKAKLLAAATGKRTRVEKLTGKNGRVQWLATVVAFTAGAYDIDEAAPRFCSAERDEAYRGPEHNTVTVKREVAPTTLVPVKHTFTTSNRQEALAMAKARFGSVKTTPEGYLVTWTEKVRTNTEDLPF